MKNAVFLLVLLMIFSCSKEEAPMINDETQMEESMEDGSTTDEGSDEDTTANTAPEKASIVAPINNETVQQFLNVVLKWEGSDADEDQLTYAILFGEDPTNLELFSQNISADSLVVERLETGKEYFWQVISNDGNEGESMSDLSGFTIYEKVFEGDYTINSNSEANQLFTEGYTRVTGNLMVDGENINLSRLSNINQVGGILIIDNTDFFNLDGLEYLLTVESLYLRNNGVLQNLNALAKVTLENGYLWIENNAVLPNLGELEIPSEVRGINIDNNPALQDFSAFSNVISIQNELIITRNESIVDFSGFNALEHIGSFLSIWNNNNIISLDGLDSLKKVEREDLTIYANPKLANIDALKNLTKCGIRFGVGDNGSLIEIDLPNLNEVDGFVEIFNNTSLTNLSGFRELKTSPSLFISQNTGLQQVDAFDKSNLLGSITIEGNPSLIEIKGFENLESTNIRIADNLKLNNFCTFSTAAQKAIEERKELQILGNDYNPTTEMVADKNQCSQ